MVKGSPRRFFIRPCAVMENYRSTILRRVSIIICPANLDHEPKLSLAKELLSLFDCKATQMMSVTYCLIGGFMLPSNTFILVYIEIFAVFFIIIANGFKCQGATFPSARNVPHMHWLIEDIRSNTSTARFTRISNQVCMCSWPVCKSKGTMALKLTTSWDDSGGNLVGLMKYSELGGRKSLFTKIGRAPVFHKFFTINRGVRRIYDGNADSISRPAKNDATWCQSSSYFTNFE